MRSSRRLAAMLAVSCGGGAAARGEPGDGLFVDGGLVVAMPAALPTGLSLGVGLGVTGGGRLAWGARASWSSATEHSLSWTVRHDDVRLRAATAWQHAAGRGLIALRLDAGGTLVRESRSRDQGERAGLTGDDLATTSWALLPAADLELAVTLRLVDAWSLAVSGGPSLDLLDGSVRAGWIGALGVAWHD